MRVARPHPTVPSTEPPNADSDPWSLGNGRLRAFVAYVRKVYHLPKLLKNITDARKEPPVPPELIAAAVFFCGLLRIRSFNALEPKLKERTFLNLVGAPLNLVALCSADTLGRSLRGMDLSRARKISDGTLAQAERNKVFREGWIGALRYVAIDGWEPICSYKRHCKDCLVRHVSVKQVDGTVKKVKQYYHRYVVAMIIDDRLDMVLDIEPLLPRDVRSDATKKDVDEGELTAAKRLLRRVKKHFSWVDVVVADGLYPNGPFLTLVKDLRMGAVIIARKGTDEPLKEALNIWGDASPHQVVTDDEAGERLELWDCRDLETLDTYKGPIRVVRGQVTKLKGPDAGKTSTWCMVVTGKATKLAPRQVLAVARGRWHIENTAFGQWTLHWKFTHVFTHDGNAILALYWLFIAAFNLLTLFLYRQLRSYGRDRGKDVTQTISRLIDEMLDDLARLTSSPWEPG